ncbi:MAG: S1 RNA-binding domain-containing protein, partial [Rikenellaceae bacterium]
RDERKMSLGIKQLTNDPWAEVEAKYSVGSKHTAKVRNFTNFGVFVEIEEGVDGLIHISDLSWTKKIKHPSEFTAKGDSIEVVVLEIDKENRRLSLGHKQLEDNPWDVFETIFTVDSIQKGTVAEISDKGVIVTLDQSVEGFVPARQLSKEAGELKVGDVLDFKVIEFVKATKRITLTTRLESAAKEAPEATEPKANKGGNAEGDNTKDAVKKLNSSMEKTTLGDISGLAALKAQLEGK